MQTIKRERRPAGENSEFTWICSKLENILFYNWTTSSNCKYIHKVLEKVSRFAKFCLVLKSIRGHSSLFGSLFRAKVGICRESQISSEKSILWLIQPK